MQIEVLQEQLLAGFNIVGRAVGVRAQLPVLSHILIEAKNEGVVLSATDLELGIRTQVFAKVIVPGKVVVPAKIFGEFLSSLNPGKIELKLEGEALVLIAPGYKSKFQTMSPDEFPQIVEVAKEAKLCKVKSEELLGAVERVTFACAKDSLRPVLTGVLFEVTKTKIRLVATDGFRLAVEEHKAEMETEGATLLVPARVVMEVLRLASNDDISIGSLPATNQIFFVVGETQIVSQLLSGSFPDYQKIIPKEFTTEVMVEKDQLLQAIKATHIFARDNSNMVRWQVEEGKLVLLSNSPERGECVVEVPIRLTGEPIEIVFNAKYILDYLMIVQGSSLWIGMGGKLSPGMIKDPKRESGQYVVMPINA